MSFSAIVTGGLVLLAIASPGNDKETRLLRSPAISAERVAFVYANDIWIAGRDGGVARRLTTFQGAETEPHFSPDGMTVAFSGEYDGNIDVYTVSVAGGEPRRLTWHPGPDFVRGWTNDGRRVVFSSGRTSAPIPYSRFWTVSVESGNPEPMALPRVHQGKFSPDGRRFVYQMIQQWETEWRNYRGGQNNPIRIIDLSSLEVEKLPWEGSNDKDPVWIGDKIFFLSDRDFAMNVWSYDLATRELRQVTRFKEFDAKNLEAGAGTLIFEMGGYLYTLDPAVGEPKKLTITAAGDFPWARPHWESVGDQIRMAALSPSGVRAVFESRGEIFTVPAEKGDVRNLSRTSGAAERAPAWSPDGQSIAWFSDEGGEYRLVISDQYGNNRKTIELRDATFYYTPAWSPDSKHLAFTDADRNLRLVEVASGRVKLIDNEGFAHPQRLFYPEWSPDSKWIAYSKRLKNQYNALFVYSLDSGRTTQLTDGLSDSRHPAWDKGGKYLYFLASTDFGLNVGWLDMSSIGRAQTFAIYLAVLPADEPSPLKPESDDEKPKAEGEEVAKEEKKEEGEKSVTVRIDFQGIDQRIIALDVPERSYGSLQAGAEGTIFYTESIPNENGAVLHRYTLKDREAKQVMGGVTGFWVSADGKKLLYSAPGDSWGIVDASGEAKPGDGALKLADMRLKVEPGQEWKQIFREAWRYQRDFFYVDNVHGLDLDWAYRTYGPWVDHVRHRVDLTYVLDILGGETAIGHSFTGGGDTPDVERVPVGLLGVDLEAANGRYRIAKIYVGENWNPDLRAPLSGPGIDARVGDYIIAVNGVELTVNMNPYSLFDRTADKQTVLTLNGRPDRNGARDVTVVPVANEFTLRARDWMEGNRRKVDELSGGRLGYVWLPNTSISGYTNFNRYYFAQQHKQGIVVDERWNGGGFAADYMVDLMSRELVGFFNNPVGDRQPLTMPIAAVWGPKVMITNDAAGSGGDFLPYMFRLKGIGPLVGTRTWGGLVGIWDVPPLIDGGFITAPRGGFYNLDGEWAVENEGVAPDYEVEQTPKLVNQGRDPQLERAVEIALELLDKQKVTILPQPPDPVRVKRPN